MSSFGPVVRTEKAGYGSSGGRRQTSPGFVDFEHVSWIGFFAPPGMPAAVVRTLDTEINNALRQPDVRERLVNLAFEPRTSSQREFVLYVNSEMAKWEQIVKKTGITLR